MVVLFINRQRLETAQVYISGWMDRQCFVICFITKKKKKGKCVALTFWIWLIKCQNIHRHWETKRKYLRNKIHVHWQMSKELVYIHNGILFSHKSWENHALCGNMDGPWGHYSKWNRTEKDKNLMITLPCRTKQNKTKMKTQTHKNQAHRKTSDLWFPEVMGRRGNWKKLVKRYKLTVIR